MAQDVVVPLEAEQAYPGLPWDAPWLRKHVGNSYSHTIQGFWLVDYGSGILVGWFSRRTLIQRSEIWLVVQHLYLQYGIYMRAQLLGVSTPPAPLPPLLLCTWVQFCTRSASQLIRICFFHRTLLTGAKFHSRYDHSIQRDRKINVSWAHFEFQKVVKVAASSIRQESPTPKVRFYVSKLYLATCLTADNTIACALRN